MSMDYSALKRNHTSEDPQFNYFSEATALALPSFFTELKLARTALTAAIQSYQASCVKLITACAAPIYQPSQHLTAKNVLAAVDSELKSLASEEDALRQIHASLLGARKKLAAAIPLINELPAEILVNIFTLLNPGCYMSRSGPKLPNFTSVCTHWRHIALDTPHLWTHVDVGPSVPDGLAEMLLDRTKGTPIHIHLSDAGPRFHSTRPRYLSGHRIISTLAPHIHQAHTLEVRSYFDSPANFTALLSLWLQKGTPSLAKSLMVYQPVSRALLSLDVSAMDELKAYSANVQAMMRSLSRLHLQNVHFNCDSCLHHGLVELQLFGGSTPISVSTLQVADIISASPTLTALKLRSVTITSSDSGPPSAPIVLSHLQLLSLSHIRSDSLQHLLTLLTLTNSSAKVSIIGPHNLLDTYPEVESLVVRSHIAELYFSQDYDHILSEVWSSFLGLPGPLSLILNQFSLEGIDFPAEEHGPTLSSRPLDITLSECYVDPEGLRAIVARSNVQSLCLDRCTILEDGPEEDGIPVSEFNFEEYPELQAKCTVSEISTDTQRDCYGDI
ncbi:hypothetical protein FRC09_018704 [Ceratobasidium sp. 395]|nr:hypothetical protein FRC09_018704 [Ceratobasidium sp. 395]